MCLVMDEVQYLRVKTLVDEDLILRAEAYFNENQYEWSRGVASYFHDMLAQKRERLHYEVHRIMLLEVALGLR